MKNFSQKIYSFSLGFIQIISLLLVLSLFLAGFLSTSYAADMTTQQALIRLDNPLLCIPLTFLGLAVLWGLSHFIKRNPKRAKHFLLLATMGWIGALGAILILFGKTVPAADAYSVYGAAKMLSQYDTSVINPTDSYLSYYPQQVGLMAFLEILHRIWNLLPLSLPAYHFMKGIYVLLLCVAVFFQYKSVDTLWENDSIDCIYLILAGANLPLIMYSSFVYGEIPSFTAFSIGLYLLLELLRKVPTLKSISRKQLFQMLLCLLFFSLGVMLRKNTLILIIAVVLVLVLEGIRLHRAFPLLLAFACTLCALSILPLTQSYYEHRSGSTLSSGVPAMSYFAMGMQEASRGCGWYNGFNFNTYQETGMDTELTNEISRHAMEERLEVFRANPSYALSFYQNKFLTQWADGTYASRQATLATFGGRSSFFTALYEGKYSHFYIEYCNVYQNLLYLGALIFCILQVLPQRFTANKKWNTAPITGLSLYLGFIGILGGFLFHFIWEANSRYIFIYSLLMLPYAARGLAALVVHFPLGNSRKIV